MKSKLNIHFSLLFAGMLIVLWTALRFFLWLSLPQGSVPLFDLAKTFILGIWFDVATLTFCISPLFVLGAIIPNRLRASGIAKNVAWIFLLLVFFLASFGLISEYIFWQEFSTRFNFIAVDYLIYTTEVIGNIRESYPVGLILMMLGIFSCFFIFVLHHFFALKTSPINLKQRVVLLMLAIGLPFTSVQLSSVEQATSSFQNAYAQELSLNGMFSFAAAMRRNDLDYERFYFTADKQQVAKILRDLRSGSHAKNKVGKHYSPSTFIKRPKNVVLITVESLSADYLGVYGNQQSLTPNLDKLAKQSLVFDRIYATGTRTVRGLEALSLGTPPIPGQAIVRRPANQHLSTIGEYLEQQGVQTAFIYGGYGYFDNMNAYFKGNDYKVFDRTDFDPKSIVMENVWGVADESLFDNTLQYIEKNINSSSPFFIQVMTTSNHRPYTFPDGRIDLPQGSRKAAVKYTDYAIGRFIELAKKKSWFEDTLFVIVADHCASVAGKTHLPVGKYHIPMLFYGPRILKPGHVESLISQIDVAPTLIDLMGFHGSEHFFGDNIFNKTSAQQKAFISNYQSLGYYKNDKLVVLLPKKQVKMYSVDSKTFEASETEVDQKMLLEAVAYYQTASVDFKSGRLKELTVK